MFVMGEFSAIECHSQYIYIFELNKKTYAPRESVCSSLLYAKMFIYHYFLYTYI